MTPRILIIVQNLPVPFDRRVWLECQALTEAGYQVAVVCPKGQGDPAYEVIDGVELYKYRPYAPGGSKLSFVAEYAYSFAATAWKTLHGRGGAAGSRSSRRATRRTSSGRWRWRSGRPSGPGSCSTTTTCAPSSSSPASAAGSLPYKGLRFLERRTHRTADHVISTNESYRDIAITQERQGPGRRDGRPHRAGPGQAPAGRAGRGPAPRA